MNRKIVSITIAIAIMIGIIIFVAVREQENPQVSTGQNLVSPTPPEGRHLQLSINESVGIKSIS
jgi:hypothetical protein